MGRQPRAEASSPTTRPGGVAKQADREDGGRDTCAHGSHQTLLARRGRREKLLEPAGGLSEVTGFERSRVYTHHSPRGRGHAGPSGDPGGCGGRWGRGVRRVPALLPGNGTVMGWGGQCSLSEPGRAHRTAGGLLLRGFIIRSKIKENPASDSFKQGCSGNSARTCQMGHRLERKVCVCVSLLVCENNGGVRVRACEGLCVARVSVCSVPGVGPPA